MNVAMLYLSHPPLDYNRVNPFRNIDNWYDLLTDPFSVIKKKCKPTLPPEGENFEVHEVCYLAGIFTEDKITSPSSANEKDTVLNNIILGPNDELLQMYFITTSELSTELKNRGLFKICVREFKRRDVVMARQFISRLQ